MDTKTIIEEIAKRKELISQQRDALRHIVEDAEAVIESCERADEALGTAIDALSEYL